MTTYIGPNRNLDHYVRYSPSPEGPQDIESQEDEMYIAELIDRTEQIVRQGPVFETQTVGHEKKYSEKKFHNTVSDDTKLETYITNAVEGRIAKRKTTTGVPIDQLRYISDAKDSIIKRIDSYLDKGDNEKAVLNDAMTILSTEPIDVASLSLVRLSDDKDKKVKFEEVLVKAARLFDEKIDEQEHGKDVLPFLRYSDRISSITKDLAGCSEEDMKLVAAVTHLYFDNVKQVIDNWRSARKQVEKFGINQPIRKSKSLAARREDRERADIVDDTLRY